MVVHWPRMRTRPERGVRVGFAEMVIGRDSEEWYPAVGTEIQAESVAAFQMQPDWEVTGSEKVWAE